MRSMAADAHVDLAIRSEDATRPLGPVRVGHGKGARDAALGVDLEYIGRRVRDRIDLVIRAEDTAIPLARVAADATKEHESVRVGIDLEDDVRIIRDGVDEAVAAEHAVNPLALDRRRHDAEGGRGPRGRVDLKNCLRRIRDANDLARRGHEDAADPLLLAAVE